MIGPHTILTASHCVWHSDKGEIATGTALYPGFQPGSSSAPLADPTASVHFNQISDLPLIGKAGSQLDFAIMDVATDLSAYGWMGRTDNFAGGTVWVAGYPAAMDGSLFWETGTVTLDPAFTVLDWGTAFALPGMSGGPVFVQGNSGSSVVGVVSSDGCAVQLTTADWQTIQGWIRSDSWMWGDDYPNATNTTGYVWVDSSAVAGNIETPHDRDWFPFNSPAT